MVSALVDLVHFKIESRFRSFICLHGNRIYVSSLISFAYKLLNGRLYLLSVVKTRSNTWNALYIDLSCVIRSSY